MNDGANSFRPEMVYEIEVVAANYLTEASTTKTIVTQYLGIDTV